MSALHPAVGARLDANARKAWNESFQRRLSPVYESAQEAMSREAGIRGFLLAAGREAQKRGARIGRLAVP